MFSAGSLLRKTKDEVFDMPALTRVMRKVDIAHGSAEAKRYKRTLAQMKTQRKRLQKSNLHGSSSMPMAEALTQLNELRHANSLVKVSQRLEHTGCISVCRLGRSSN